MPGTRSEQNVEKPFGDNGFRLKSMPLGGGARSRFADLFVAYLSMTPNFLQKDSSKT